MLGILIALLTAAGVVGLTLMRRDLPLLVLIAIFMLTAEMGEGFTSFEGSIFFNQNFLHLANLKLVEVILYSYAGILILLEIPLHRKLAASPVRRLYWFWLVWLVVLLIVQYQTRGSFDIIGFRGVYFGWAVLYVLASVVDSRLVMRRVMLFTFILLVVRALWLMLMFAAGRGDHTGRGYSPIFWDDKLLEAFTWVFLVFLVCVLQPQNEKGRWPTTWALASMALIAVLIALSLRRNYLGQAAIGVLFLLLFYRNRQIQMRRFFFLAVVGAVLFGIIFVAGEAMQGRLPLAQQLLEYSEMLNFSSASEFSSLSSNEVHLSNVQEYVTLLLEYPGIQLFGRSAAPTDDFQNFNREYSASLGLAHNGPLRAIFDYGIGGLIVWSGFFYLTFRAIYRCKLEQLEPWERAVVIGTAAAIFGHFIVSLTVIPPFFTTTKSLFIFLFMVYVVELYGRESKVVELQTAGATSSIRPAENYAAV
jgi:hypothetical protein